MTPLQVGLLAALFLTAFIVLLYLYLGRGYWASVVAVVIALGGWAVMGIESPRAFAAAIGSSLVAALVFGVPALRRWVVTCWLMRPVGAMLPRMGDTERIALEAGTVWFGPVSTVIGLAFRLRDPERLLTRDIYVPAASRAWARKSRGCAGQGGGGSGRGGQDSGCPARGADRSRAG